MAPSIRKPKGTRDFLPEDLRVWRDVEATFHTFAERYGYGPIRTPLFEDRALFARGLGEASDVVSKELYVIETGGGKYALRPEQTASVVRAYLENGLHKSAPFSKFYYIGPQFRHERQQKNRYRQFYQLGVEALGSRDPLLDAEVIELAVKFLGACGLEGLTVRVNTLGAPATLERYRDALREALEPHRERLGETDRQRLDTNVLRVLDSKDPAVQQLRPDLPAIDGFLTDEESAHFAQMREALAARNIDHEIDATLVRGLDYYTGPVFELFYQSTGTQDALGAGGRYDGLVEQLGGPPTPCVGFALGLDRIVNAVAAERGVTLGKNIGKANDIDVYVIVERRYWFPIELVSATVGYLRDRGLVVEYAPGSGEYREKRQISHAKRRKAKLAIKLLQKDQEYWLEVVDLKSWESRDKVFDHEPTLADMISFMDECDTFTQGLLDT